jgi:G3E family GTPase
MNTGIYIISGFLGAGKTTLIQKLLRESFRKDKVVLVENDFGDISVDAALLGAGGIQVTEINSGCICCTLSGDFIKTLEELLTRYRPDTVIIEPSGVGKLSDIEKACADPRIRSLAEIKRKITVVDVKRCAMYLENFGEFFEDQIGHADVVLLSRTEDFPEKVDDARKLIGEINPGAPVHSKPWEQIDTGEILSPHDTPIQPKAAHHAGHMCNCAHGHGAHECEDHCECKHNHCAEDVFDTVTVRTNRVFDIKDLRARVSDMERRSKGTILRAKGLVRGTDGYLNVQYLPGDLKIESCAAGGDMLCVIGRNLNKRELAELFGGAL